MLIVGIDGGGTKTEAVLCDDEGRVLRRVRGGPTSPTSLPVTQVKENLAGIMECLMAEHDGLNGRIDALFAGLSGGSVGNNAAVIRDMLVELLPGCRRIANFSDSINALRSAVPQGDALVAISGTGSSVFACVNGQMRQCGGWGYLLGDEGSGFDLGQRALRSALRALDGRGPDTSLAAACQDKLGQDVRQAIPRLYQEGRPGIAAFAPVLLSQAQAGDAVAQRELEAAAAGLAETITAAGRWLPASLKRTAIAGSVWKSAIFRRQVRRILSEDYCLCETDLPPVYGSFVIALRQAGLTPDAQVEGRFRATLPRADEA